MGGFDTAGPCGRRAPTTVSDRVSTGVSHTVAASWRQDLADLSWVVEPTEQELAGWLPARGRTLDDSLEGFDVLALVFQRVHTGTRSGVAETVCGTHGREAGGVVTFSGKWRGSRSAVWHGQRLRRD